RRQHLLRSPGAAPESFQSPVRQHGQSRRAGRRARSRFDPLSEFMEKAQKIKVKVIAAMFYPVAVLIVATGILIILMVKVIPSFEQVFIGMAEGAQLPAFTRLVLGISRAVKDHILYTLGGVAVFVVLFVLFKKTKFGRRVWDKFKL